MRYTGEHFAFFALAKQLFGQEGSFNSFEINNMEDRIEIPNEHFAATFSPEDSGVVDKTGGSGNPLYRVDSIAFGMRFSALFGQRQYDEWQRRWSE